MGFWALVFILMTALAIESGDITMIFFFGGLAALFTYLWATREEREKMKRRQELERKEQEKQQKKLETQRRALSRFQSSSFASQIIREIRGRSFQDLDYQRGGCQVLTDKIVTPFQTYQYTDYGLGKLDVKSCEELAEFLSMALGSGCTVKVITKFVGGVSPSFTISSNSDGGYSVTQDAWGGDRPIGYRVYSNHTVPAAAPKGRSW